MFNICPLNTGVNSKHYSFLSGNTSTTSSVNPFMGSGIKNLNKNTGQSASTTPKILSSPQLESNLNGPKYVGSILKENLETFLLQINNLLHTIHTYLTILHMLGNCSTLMLVPQVHLLALILQ